MPMSNGAFLSRVAALALCSATLLAGCNGGPALDLATNDIGGSVVSSPGAKELPLPEPVLTPAQQRDAALSMFLASRQIAEVPEYRAAQADLDADGVDDLLMLLDDPNWCSDAGCSLLVFRGDDDAGYRLVTETTVTHAPIAVGAQRHNGWHDLLVGVGGDGTQAGTVALQFNGEGYPRNPTLLAMLAEGSTPRANVLIE
ncbi:hypothetical protein [Novilysobacter erysipheiresistens]|uniref:Lipoprotein n=1 Tax=Novilysobacter erysipheiresistens TaxID=1749332 RepID=A0ABU7Z0E3_9GAMM